MQEGLLTIGEMSQICKVSKRTLRYYDGIGLIKPAYANEENGYRYYEPYQVGRIFLIKQMQELGISLEDVSNCVREKGKEVQIEEFFTHISRRKIEIQEEIKTLLKQQNTIEDYISQYGKIKEQLHGKDEAILIKYIGKRYLLHKQFSGKLNEQMFGRTFAEIGCAISNSAQRQNELLPQIGSLFCGERNSENCRNKIGFFMEQKMEADPFCIEEIEEGYYATYRYVGDYANIDKEYEFMREYLVSLNYPVKNFCVEIYQVSVNITLNDREFITELQVPIELGR
jgi:Predicted transcriptional regulators